MSQNSRVALCVTCLVDQVIPEVGTAAVGLLRRAGCQVEFPTAQTCCGQSFFNSGRHREAAELARRTVEIFEPYDAVVAPSGSCTSMIKMEYPRLLESWPDWCQRARSLAAKTYELTQFLVEQTAWSPTAATARKVTYHDSCHMCRLLGVRDAPRQLLRAAGCQVEEMVQADRCCGFGGLFSVRMPEVSNAMTKEKLQRAQQSGAEVVVTADPGCLLQMRGLAAGGVAVEHIATVLEDIASESAKGG